MTRRCGAEGAHAPALAAPGLSRRQGEVLWGIAHGESAKVTARRLGLAPDTVKMHRRKAFRKLGARSAGEAVRLALLATG